MARRRIPFTVDLIREALARRGLDVDEGGAERVRLRLGLPERDGNLDDGEALRAARALISSDAFRGAGAAAVAKAVPGLRRGTGTDGVPAWSVLARIPLLDDGRLEVRIEVPAGAGALAVLSGMAERGDPEWRLRDLRADVTATEARVADGVAGAVRSIRVRLRRDLANPDVDQGRYVASLDHALRSRILPGGPDAGGRLEAKFGELRDKALSGGDRLVREKRLFERAGFRTYLDRFAPARGLGRRLVFHAGPTNSGKTYAALEALSAAATGTYLAPLRLLALENYEALAARGLRAAMVTGEETLGEVDATHVSRTIEAADLRREVDVAVIDEIQMLSDPDRGWAWTNALLGIPARTVILCGSEDALPYLRRAAAASGERLDVVPFRRKTPLVLQDGPVGIDEVEAGDAVVAFSRQAVHEAREALLDRGLTVAAVYGALSPEVRRAEAARFREREAEVLVTTDAVGMGLNLGPLRRMVFATTHKWDGRRDRPLTNPEIRQIAGRAGRFGHQSEGFVAVFSEEDLAPVRAALAGAPAAPPEDDRFYVRPDAVALGAVADELGTESLAEALGHFARSAFYEGSPFQPCDLEDSLRLARVLDRFSLPFAEKHAFTLCPLDPRDPVQIALLEGWAHQRASGGAAPALRAPREKDLETHERTVRIAGAYLWLAKRYPATFDDPEGTRRTRAAANQAIRRALSEAPRRTVAGTRGAVRGERPAAPPA